jgi:iron(III) transport system substrate-binding protein
MKSAPNPNAARLFQSYMLSAECQQFNIEVGGLRSAHKLVKDKPGRKPMNEIKVMKDDAEAVEKQSADLKAHYTKLFKV